MEIRIAKMEKEIALMAQTQRQVSASLKSITDTLSKMSSVQLDTKLLDERLHHMDKDLVESFSRVHKRIDDLEASRNILIRIIVGGFLTALVGLTFNGGFM